MLQMIVLVGIDIGVGAGGVVVAVCSVFATNGLTGGDDYFSLVHNTATRGFAPLPCYVPCVFPAIYNS